MKHILYLTPFLLLLFACSHRTAETIVSHQTDTLYQFRERTELHHDLDSIFIYQSGDTVLQSITRWRYRNREIHDTIYRAKTDTVRTDKIIYREKDGAEKLNFLQRLQLSTWPYCFCALIIIALIAIAKHRKSSLIR